MVPAALRLMVMVLSRLSPKTDSMPAPGMKLAVIAMEILAGWEGRKVIAATDERCGNLTQGS